MQFHDLACSSMSLHEVWVCLRLQFHEVACSSFLCLGSSQEFFSACLISHCILNYCWSQGRIRPRMKLAVICQILHLSSFWEHFEVLVWCSPPVYIIWQKVYHLTHCGLTKSRGREFQCFSVKNGAAGNPDLWNVFKKMLEHYTYTNSELQCFQMRGQFSFLDLSNTKPNLNKKSLVLL